MAFATYKHCYLTDLAQELEIKYSVVYHWYRSGIITATKMTVPEFLDFEILWSMGKYWFKDATGMVRSTRPVRLVVRLEDVRWLFIIKDELPDILEWRPRGFFKFEKAEYKKLMKGDDSNE